MPKVVIDDLRGLVQEAGSGVDIQNGIDLRKAATATNTDTKILIGKPVSGNQYAESATQLHPLGTVLIDGERKYRYVKMGASGVTAGLLVQGKAIHHATNHINMAITANVAAGARVISVETGGGNFSKDLYAEGWLWVNDGVGEGQAWKVRSNPAHVHASDPSVEVTLYDPVVTAITQAGTEVSIIENKYKGVVVGDGATARGNMSLGFTVIDMTADYFGWILVSGPGCALTSGAIVRGDIVVATTGGGTAGAVIAKGADAAPVRVQPDVGIVLQVNATTDYSLVDVMIEP